MKNILVTIIFIVGIMTTSNAQGITMTLGGNTADDKFIVENSDSEAGLVVTGEGNVGIGTTNPLSKLSIGGDGTGNATIYGETAVGHNGAGVIGLATNTGAVTNYGGNFSAAGEYGNGVYGEASNSSENATNHGGYFRAHGKYGRGVYGQVLGSDGFGVFGDATHTGNVTNYGGYFRAAGESGFGVYGEASNSGAGTNYGGYFKAAGTLGRGVYGSASGNSGRGVYGISTGSSGLGVYGLASNTGSVKNYGGYFKANGDDGRGVYGIATKTGNVTNYGGYFKASGWWSSGVYGEALGSGYGVHGLASFNGNVKNYGGRFQANGYEGVGVYGWATYAGSATNYGGYFKASGNRGIGVYGEALGYSGKGVVGSGFNYDFYAAGGGIDYGTSSSIRWKNNIVEIDNPLEKLVELRGVYFDWDEEHGGQHDVGMIAEEVGKVLPEIVVYEENGIDADGMDYSKITPLLVEVAKAQQNLIEELTKRIEELENR